jgi:hypothetical protein
MTPGELADLLDRVKWLLVDSGYTRLAGEYEDVAQRIRVDQMNAAACHEYARAVLPPGRRGRCVLVIDTPYSARAKAALAFLLSRVTDPAQ